MRAVVIREFVSALDEVKVSDVAPPAAKDDELVIQVKAAGVNYVDTLYARGKHQNNRSLVRPPFTLGLEFSGTVLSAPSPSSEPSNGHSFRAGDRVFGDASGAYAELLTLPLSTAKASLHRMPDGWSFTQAAGVAATLPVAYGALVVRGRLKRGETVLVHGAAGGLGVMAVQVCRAIGCRVIATASTPKKCEVVRSLGPPDMISCIDTSTNAGKEWWKLVLERTGGRGADVVYDPVGLVDRSLKCTAHGGRVLIVGFAGRDETSMEGIKMNRVLLKQVHLIGYRYGESQRRHPEEKDRIWNELRPLIDKGEIKPVVFDREYRGLESVPRALKDIASRQVWGKAVITVDPETSEGRLEKPRL